MSKTRRVFTIIGAVFVILGSLVLMQVPEIAFELIAIGIAFMLTIYGIKYLIYYITHAQHMVGGKWLMLVGLVLLDLGALFDLCAFASMLIDQARAIMIIYVAGAHFIAAVLNIIRTVGNKKDSNPSWKIDLAQGIGNFAQVVLCLVFINHISIPVYIYCIGCIYTAILMIVSACNKTAIVYVQ